MPSGKPVSMDAAKAAASADALAFASAAARIAHETRSENVVVLDLRGLSSVADFFVLGTGTSDRQMRAVLDAIATYGRTVGRKPFRVADTDAAWLLGDYVDVVIHLFDDRHRRYYDLDGLWGDAPRVDWESQRSD